MKKPTSGYSTKQKSFLALLADGTPEREAALQVWDKNTVRHRRYRRSDKLKKAIKTVKTDIAEICKVTRDDILVGFLDAVNIARLKEDPMAMVAAYREIGKMTGNYEPQVTRHEVQLLEAGEYDQMTTAKLLELAGDDDAITLEASEYEVVEVEVGDDSAS